MTTSRLFFAAVDDPFLDEVRRRARAYFAGRSRYGGPRMWVKSAVLIAMLALLGIVIYAGNLSGGAFVAVFVLWQFVQFSTTIGIAHDATHDAYARSPRVNRAIERIFDLLGIDSKTWIDTHLDAHHARPNVPLFDSAITSFSLVRLHPRTERTWLSRYQHFTMFFVYAFVTIFQVYFLEPTSFAQNVIGFERRRGFLRALAKMVAKKVFVLGYSLVLPLVVLKEPWWLVVSGWVLGHMVCGIAIGVIFQTTHLHERTTFPEPNADGRLAGSFAQHVLKTTAEFSTENPLVTWIAGGLNLHVTHHLFPRVSQVHLPALSRIVRETARELGAPYVEYTLFGAVRSHLRTLKRLGSLPSMASW